MSAINLQYLANHQQTVLQEIRRNEATLMISESLSLEHLEEIWEKQHKLTNVILWLQNVAKSMQEQADEESRIIKPGNVQMHLTP
jgi:hypothetical protein